MLDINERSSKTFTVKFKPSAPTTARWRLKSIDNDEIVKDWTAITTPATSQTITITSDLNKIRRGKEYEIMEIAVQADYDDTSLKKTQSYRYRIRNVSAVDDGEA